MARPVLLGNPHVDEVWEIPMKNKRQAAMSWHQFVRQAERRKKAGEFDLLFLTQIFPDNFAKCNGTIRGSIFSSYPRPITVPIEPVLVLSDEEKKNIRDFAERNGLREGGPGILFECSSESGQSFMTPELAIEIAKRLHHSHPDFPIVFSTRDNLPGLTGAMIDGSGISFRENAGLAHYLSLLVGCSSGISWITTSSAGKKLPTVQLIYQESGASLCRDAETFGWDDRDVIEMCDSNPLAIAECLSLALQNQFSQARERFHVHIPFQKKYEPSNDLKKSLYPIYDGGLQALREQFDIATFFYVATKNIRRYGILSFLRFLGEKLRRLLGVAR